ncbi:acidic phospholipase A2-like [Branchiostoma lanceolatum]|uniref:acidic phospholipase A2-like n=1 Tax=Branchiostoma lanceolatum TaxID=7740 RepID=UPI003452E261
MESGRTLVIATVVFLGVVIVSSEDTKSPDLSRPRRNIFQTMIMLSCITDKSSFDYSDYGCYCGPGGEGKPVDILDQCCKVHDECYGTAENNCFKFFEYLGIYDYKCENGKISCDIEDRTKMSCREFLCECDRKVAECLTKNEDEYNSAHFHMDQDKCKG